MIIIKHPDGSRRFVNENTNFGFAPGEYIDPKEATTEGVQLKADMSDIEQAFKDEGLLFGDAIAMATKALGFEPCSGCTRRQEWINGWHRRGKAFVKEVVTKLKGI